MLFKKYKIISILIISSLLSQARIGDWGSFTSSLIVHDLIELNGKIYCATEGGLLIYDVTWGEFSTLTNLDGLIGTNLNVIAKDLYGNIWTGGAAPDGFVQVYDLSEASSIAEFDFDFTEIIDIAIGDTITLAIYKEDEHFRIWKFRDRGTQWDHNDLMDSDWLFSDQIAGIVIWNDSVFVATNQGLRSGDLQEGDNDDAHEWGKESEELSGNITSIHLIQNELMIIMDNAPYSIDLNTMEIFPIHSNVSLVEFVKSFNNELWGIRSDDRKALVHLESDLEISVDHQLNVVIPLTDGFLAGGTEAGIVLLNSETQEVQQLIPNAPLTNQFTAITVLDDGRIVAGSKYGLTIKEDWGWRNIVETTTSAVIVHDSFNYNFYAADTIPVDFGGYVADLEQGPDGLVYCAIRGTYPEPLRHGGGIIIIDVDNPLNFSIIDTTNLSYFTTSSNLNPYMVVKDLKFDSNGNLWVADTYATNKFEPIQVQNTDGVWGSFFAEPKGELSLTPNTISIDLNDRVWIGSFESGVNGIQYPNGGLVMLTYAGDPSNPNELQIKNIGLGMSTKTIWSLGITQENRLYILTPLGLSYLDLGSSDDDPILRQGPRASNGDLYHYFPNISFGGPDPHAKLKVDSHGNVWATSTLNGLHILLNNATYWPDIDGFQKSNSLLLSDGVTDIEFDNNKGIAWISTNRGINSLRMPFAQSVEHYQAMKIFPSPFHIPSATPLIIDKLKDASSLKVMTITGSIIRKIKDQDMGIHGNQITWDGKDSQGRWVNSGVYLLTVYDQTGNSNIGKITVIRH